MLTLVARFFGETIRINDQDQNSELKVNLCSDFYVVSLLNLSNFFRLWSPNIFQKCSLDTKKLVLCYETHLILHPRTSSWLFFCQLCSLWKKLIVSANESRTNLIVTHFVGKKIRDHSNTLFVSTSSAYKHISILGSLHIVLQFLIEYNLI